MTAAHWPKSYKTTDNLNGSWYKDTHLGKRSQNGDAVIRQLASVHDQYRTFCDNFVDAFQNPDPTDTDAGHFIKMREMAFKKVESACDANNRAIEVAEAEIRACQAAMRSTLEMVENYRAAEIRGYLRELPKVERADVLAVAIKNKDAATIAAVVDAPGYLSGHTEEQRTLYRTRYEREHNPQLAARMDDLNQALAINKAAKMDLPEFVDSIVPFKKYTKLKKEQEAAKARRDAISV